MSQGGDGAAAHAGWARFRQFVWFRSWALRSFAKRRPNGRRKKPPDLETELFWISLLITQGYSNEEIAALLGCNLRTIERKLQILDLIWGEGEER